MWLFLVFVAVPIIEIGLFVQVGGAIGLWPTLAIVLLTALAGTSLMRRQGLMTLNRLQSSLANGENPADPMVQGAMILVAGVLLLTPGFFTDTLGFLLLLPPVRTMIIRYAATRINVGGVSFSAGQSYNQPQPEAGGQTIDGEYAVVDDEEETPPKNPSGWVNH
jgi:UPF0716 protein FxsA